MSLAADKPETFAVDGAETSPVDRAETSAVDTAETSAVDETETLLLAQQKVFCDQANTCAVDAENLARSQRSSGLCGRSGLAWIVGPRTFFGAVTLPNKNDPGNFLFGRGLPGPLPNNKFPGSFLFGRVTAKKKGVDPDPGSKIRDPGS